MKFSDLSKKMDDSWEWLLHSMTVVDGKGSSASYHIWRGWSASYPETTGYLIDTLFDYHSIAKNPVIKTTAIQCTDWLCAIQLPDGAFPSGVGGRMQPIVFDTGMIVFGLGRAWRETGNERYLNSLSKAVNWMAHQIGVDETWGKFNYVESYLPAYYSMVVWAMLLANKHLKISGLDKVLHLELSQLSSWVQPNWTVLNWGFAANEAAFTHTIGYTLQGLIEAGTLLCDSTAVKSAKGVAEKLIETRRSIGKIAGSYDHEWNGDYSFECPTGNAQLSIVYFRLYEIFGVSDFLEEAQYLLNRVVQAQSNLKIKGHFGGIPGSYPIWGKYQRFSYPNWAAKFFIDAGILSRKYG